MERDPLDELGVSRFQLALAGLVFAAVAGIVHGQALNQREARNFFLLTNPNGVAGDLAQFAPAGAQACVDPTSPSCAWLLGAEAPGAS